MELKDGALMALASPEILIAGRSTAYVVVYPTTSFAVERVVIDPLPPPEWWRLRCAWRCLTLNLFYFLHNVRTLLRGGFAVWTPLYAHPPDDRRVYDVKIGAVSQMFDVTGGVPASVFYADSNLDLSLKFDVAGPNKPISVAFANKTDHPVLASFVAAGRVLPRGDK